jgi:predicted transcriptional regulator
MEPALRHDVRANIVRILATNAGCHLRGLQRRSNLGLGQLRHHLKVLEAGGFVVRQRDGRKVRYYLPDEVPLQDRELFAALYQEVPRRMLALLVARPGARHGDLARALERPAATISYHLARLQEAGLVRSMKRGSLVYYVVPYPTHVRSALEAHPKTRRDVMARRLMDTFWPLFH